MDFFKLIEERFSCRNYSDKPVEREKLENCIKAAHIAPSACNSQPWSFVVVRKPEVAQKLAELTKVNGFNEFASQCSSFIVIVEEKVQIYRSSKGDMEYSRKFSRYDVGIAAEHLALAATEQGLASCIIGSFKEDEIKELLGIPQEKIIALIVSVGYPSNVRVHGKGRKKLDEIVQYIE